ncbi:alpha/beta-hydrolase [Aspergillus sergii]|uniref:Alpha/beta-hydrolase n=1 Tax=Aspergillus sergii TaxID=1034303 RepID=A0A5N6WYH0_9EURO|nr:alpha/beta-hydrolase [Aspergillus sergii]
MTHKSAAYRKFSFLFTLLFRILPSAAFRIPGAIVRALLKKLPLGSSVWNGFVGALMDNTPPDELQAILPSTIDTYNAWVSSNGATHAVDVLAVDNSTRLLWIGPRKAKNVVLFFHGGGYVMPLSKGHLDWMAHVKKQALDAGIQLSVCILEYDLIPAKPYPRQMSQGIFAFEYLVDLGYKPSEIVFGGDSAGGHLSLSLMAHLHHPRATDHEMKNLVDLYGTVRGCFLVSPLASFDFKTAAYQRRFNADILSRKVVHKWGDYLVENSPWLEEISAGNGWGMALDVPEIWWQNFRSVDRILVTGGYEEVFSDHIQQLGNMLKRQSQGTVTLHMDSETHDTPLMDFISGRRPSETTKTITSFVISCFKG